MRLAATVMTLRPSTMLSSGVFKNLLITRLLMMVRVCMRWNVSICTAGRVQAAGRLSLSRRLSSRSRLSPCSRLSPGNRISLTGKLSLTRRLRLTVGLATHVAFLSKLPLTTIVATTKLAPALLGGKESLLLLLLLLLLASHVRRVPSHAISLARALHDLEASGAHLLVLAPATTLFVRHDGHVAHDRGHRQQRADAAHKHEDEGRVHLDAHGAVCGLPRTSRL